MDSPQSVVSPLKNCLIAESEKKKPSFFDHISGPPTKGMEVNRKEAVMYNLEEVVGALDVCIHQARDIHNICIYHKQDVYAKLCLSTDPEDSLSTKIINGAGRNPVFNENLRFNVRSVDASLKCEIWMLSRVRNYLEDQLLGFTVVPLTEVLVNDGKLEKEFSLSSTDLFHSPAGFVQLSLEYNGTSPDVMAVPKAVLESSNAALKDSEISESLASDLDKIEFPDPKIVNEDEMMVSEYFSIPGSNPESEDSESLATSGTEDHPSSETGVNTVESFSTASIESVQISKLDSPPSSSSTNGASSSPVPTSSESYDASEASKPQTQEPIEEEKHVDVKNGKPDSSIEVPNDSFSKPVITVNIEPEQNVVQQDIVDMYMKSMQQFTESLAKMKLPLDVDNEPTNSGNSSSDQQTPSSKNGNARVFYGSRAFF
ncbi:uncharacterized protein LOC101214591 [Cucumis sativus]|uniref:C2 domain-containing protein n=1 Tax=Cucumis sativus TaxID=3659 RepID=A0A0A0LAT5_CUCSA|nr:uncharacterized protein LOC101214591 [Cucumis sativus]XP_004151176.1 uncharacterized protein LOC101214591 [Cucumis sativus]KAE8645991.1 hypothetical protein Csa_015480 [Cucumis sativus]